MAVFERLSLSVTLLLCLLMVGQSALAVQDEHPGDRLQILEVFVDFDSEVIVILGEDFDFGPRPLQVELGDLDNPAAGDISSLCVDDLARIMRERSLTSRICLVSARCATSHPDRRRFQACNSVRRRRADVLFGALRSHEHTPPLRLASRS